MAAETTDSTRVKRHDVSHSTSMNQTSEYMSGTTLSEQPDFSSYNTTSIMNTTSGFLNTTSNTSGLFNFTSNASGFVSSTSNTSSGVLEPTASVSSWVPREPSIDLQLIIPLCVATGIVSCIIIGLCCFMKINDLMPSFSRSKRRSMNVRRRPNLTSQPRQEAPGDPVLLHKRHSVSAPNLSMVPSHSYPAFITTNQRVIQIRPPAERVPNTTEHSVDDIHVDTRLTQNKTFTQKGRVDAYMLGQELNMVPTKPNSIASKISDPHIYQSVKAAQKSSDHGQFASIGKRRLAQGRVGQVQLTQLWNQN
ncbi:uncharacterized protein [Asterias amurensis]|uniref:uncharacterized protein n=1 Tax=Asterias amurensis TaxID=7602 RepID=UPI003AB1D5FC